MHGRACTRVCVTMNQYLEKKTSLYVWLSVPVTVCWRVLPRPVRCFHCTRLCTRLLNSQEQIAAPVIVMHAFRQTP